MKRENQGQQGRLGKRPCWAKRGYVRSFSCRKEPGRDGRSSSYLPHVELGVANGRRLLARNALQHRFPNLPYSRLPLKSAGREAALEVGLEICAAKDEAARSYSQL
jgi:hypothetical protein